ncbi:MAG: hypothetical protein AB7P03_26235 [Kofleriaceae bacterium]
MRRVRRAAVPAGLLAAFVASLVVGSASESAADLDNQNQLFTSPADHLQMVVPRGWRATDQPSYPGLLLWMMRSKGLLVLTAEPFTRQLYCSWPVACRASADSLPEKYACALRQKLQAQRMRVGPVQPGPRDTEVSGIPTVWIEYDDGRRFLRQAVGLSADRAVSLVLSAPSNDARATHARSFDQALRTLKALDTAPSIDAGVPLGDAAISDGGSLAERSAPAPKVDPVGPCPQ